MRHVPLPLADAVLAEALTVWTALRHLLRVHYRAPGSWVLLHPVPLQRFLFLRLRTTSVPAQVTCTTCHELWTEAYARQRRFPWHVG